MLKPPPQSMKVSSMNQVNLRLPESSTPSSHKHSNFPKSRGIPNSASTIIGKGVSFANSFKNSGRVYRLGSVGISRNFGGQGGAGSGLEYRTRTRRSSFEELWMVEKEGSMNHGLVYWDTLLYIPLLEAHFFRNQLRGSSLGFQSKLITSKGKQRWFKNRTVSINWWSFFDQQWTQRSTSMSLNIPQSGSSDSILWRNEA